MGVGCLLQTLNYFPKLQESKNTVEVVVVLQVSYTGAACHRKKEKLGTADGPTGGHK